MKNVLQKVVLMLSLTASITWGQGPGVGFTVDFSQCTEFAGVGPVSFAKASASVPSVFSALTVGATGGIVVRATSCSGVKVNGGFSIPTNISQIGVEIVPPDGTGDINNYTLIYASNNAELVLAFNLAGVPAVFDPTLVYEFTYDSTGKAGTLYAEVEGLGLPPYFIFGTSSVGLYTDKTSMLGQLIGGNSDTNFGFLPLRGVYPTAHMVVTVTK